MKYHILIVTALIFSGIRLPGSEGTKIESKRRASFAGKSTAVPALCRSRSMKFGQLSVQEISKLAQDPAECDEYKIISERILQKKNEN